MCLIVIFCELSIVLLLERNKVAALKSAVLREVVFVVCKFLFLESQERVLSPLR